MTTVEELKMFFKSKRPAAVFRGVRSVRFPQAAKVGRHWLVVNVRFSKKPFKETLDSLIIVITKSIPPDGCLLRLTSVRKTVHV